MGEGVGGDLALHMATLLAPFLGPPWHFPEIQFSSENFARPSIP